MVSRTYNDRVLIWYVEADILVNEGRGLISYVKVSCGGLVW